MRARICEWTCLSALVAGCFPGPRHVDAEETLLGDSIGADGADAESTPTDAATDDGHFDGAADGQADAGCHTNDDCSSMGSSCADAICQADGTCRILPKSGDDCDDHNPCTTSDKCESGECRGTAYTSTTGSRARTTCVTARVAA